ncbi:hypothetical protein [Thiohalophilus sp.]|uniref:hypothetical protein n=1 Tax=Thiohalophilus sp. TaxID=3028392 RepID=UPI002ACE5757|nr:hypothetical protein [Thiohalophilus sp.]MDZ7660846.1 hypothetical protein [Thiohalophilus sp.]
MKTTIIAFLFTLSLISGCATSNYSVGNPFPSENVNKIVKGKTTTADLANLFGQPFSKTVISANEEKWMYMHSSGTSTAQSYVFTMDVKTTGMQKTLDILVKDDVVVNFAYTESPVPSVNVQ